MWFRPLGAVYSVMTPAVVISPILETPGNANHRFPSGPVVRKLGKPPLVGMGYSVMTPAGVI